MRKRELVRAVKFAEEILWYIIGFSDSHCSDCFRNRYRAEVALKELKQMTGKKGELKIDMNTHMRLKDLCYQIEQKAREHYRDEFKNNYSEPNYASVGDELEKRDPAEKE